MKRRLLHAWHGMSQSVVDNTFDERENFICHNIAQTNNNTNGEYVAGCQKRLKAHRAGDQKRIKN